MKLIFVNRGVGVEWYPDVHVRYPLSFINPQHVPPDGIIAKTGTVFEADDNDALVTADFLAKQNPGCEIAIYDCTGICVCPPGELVRKKVTKEGVLPE